MEDRTRKLRSVTRTTPSAITTAAPIAISADMLRMIFLWRVLFVKGPTDELGSEEFGFRTRGFGRTAGQDRLTADPQREGLSEREEGGIALKNGPTGSSPWRWLWEMLKTARWGRLASCFGMAPDRLLREKSIISRLVKLVMEEGIGPVRLLLPKFLREKKYKYNQFFKELYVQTIQ